MHRKILPHILNYSCIQSGLAEYSINFNTWADMEPLLESEIAFLFISLSVLKMFFMIEVVVYLTQ